MRDDGRPGLFRDTLAPLAGWTLLAGLCLTLGSVLANAAGASLHVSVLFGTLVGMGVPIALLGSRHGATLAVGNVRLGGLALALIIGVLLSVASNAMMILLTQLSPGLAELAEARAPFLHQVLAPDIPALWPVVLVVVAVAPGVLEEAFFRGGLRELFRRQGRTLRVGAIAVAFAALHGDLLAFLPLLLLGITFGAMAERTGGWGVAAAAHVGHNAASIVAGWIAWTEGPPEDAVEGVLAPVVAVLCAGVLAAWILARWLPREGAAVRRSG